MIVAPSLSPGLRISLGYNYRHSLWVSESHCGIFRPSLLVPESHCSGLIIAPLSESQNLTVVYLIVTLRVPEPHCGVLYRHSGPRISLWNISPLPLGPRMSLWYIISALGVPEYLPWNISPLPLGPRMSLWYIISPIRVPQISLWYNSRHSPRIPESHCGIISPLCPGPRIVIVVYITTLSGPVKRKTYKHSPKVS